MDEDYWTRHRKRLRERTARRAFLIIGPVIILGEVLGIVAPTDHPPGDVEAASRSR